MDFCLSALPKCPCSPSPHLFPLSPVTPPPLPPPHQQDPYQSSFSWSFRMPPDLITLSFWDCFALKRLKDSSCYAVEDIPCSLCLVSESMVTSRVFSKGNHMQIRKYHSRYNVSVWCVLGWGGRRYGRGGSMGKNEGKSPGGKQVVACSQHGDS